MEVIPGKYVHVQGWNQMLEDHPTRALVLQCFVYLEYTSRAPSKYEVLREMLARGADLSVKSVTTVYRHLEALVKDDHLVKLEPNMTIEELEGMGATRKREGKKRSTMPRPWRSIYAKEGEGRDWLRKHRDSQSNN